MFNLVMNEVLRQYREENGRGPNTQELLELRANIARELGVEIAQQIDGDWDKRAKANTVPSAKKLTFTKEADRVREYVPDANEYPSDRDDEDYDDVDDQDDVARSLIEDYDEEDDDNHVNQPPAKRLKTSDDDGDSKPSAAST
jgi:alkanesulfonate monooxygenase SsuD/methylene tetrahydromethanopterin reductase-like flavin-dependent oxidoreductase (luciferase family)